MIAQKVSGKIEFSEEEDQKNEGKLIEDMKEEK